MTNPERNSGTKSEPNKKRLTVLVDADQAGRLRELISRTATRHTMSSVVAKAMKGAVRFLEKRHGPFPETPEGRIKLRVGRPPQPPSNSQDAVKRIPITVYVDGSLIAKLRKAVYHSPTQFTMANVVSSALASAVRLLEQDNRLKDQQPEGS